jgi:hypothetical protein
VVGAINGHAIAGGLVLGLCCDWRIAVKTPFLAGLTEVRVGVPYPVGAMEVVRQELRPDVARQLVLFGQNMTAASAVQAGVFDEMVDSEALLDRALATAHEFMALPQVTFAKIKRQLRRGAYEAIEAAIAGAEPLLNGWLSGETIQAAAAALAARLRGSQRDRKVGDGKAWGPPGRRMSNRSTGPRSKRLRLSHASYRPDPFDFGIRLNRGRMLWPAPRAKAVVRARFGAANKGMTGPGG